MRTWGLELDCLSPEDFSSLLYNTKLIYCLCPCLLFYEKLTCVNIKSLENCVTQNDPWKYINPDYNSFFFFFLNRYDWLLCLFRLLFWFLVRWRRVGVGEGWEGRGDTQKYILHTKLLFLNFIIILPKQWNTWKKKKKNCFPRFGKNCFFKRCIQVEWLYLKYHLFCMPP